MATIPASSFKFLNQLKNNNSREWFMSHKTDFDHMEEGLEQFYSSVHNNLNLDDKIEKLKIFRIYRDVRFSKDKTPYNSHRSASWSRLGKERRGGYYLRLQPGNSYMAGGFFAPDKEDLYRIRKEFEVDSAPIRAILSNKVFKKAFGSFNNNSSLKTAPKGFSKDDSNIDLIRLKNYFVRHSFTNTEVLSENFEDNLIAKFKLLRPFFDYMSEILTTDLNGESTI